MMDVQAIGDQIKMIIAEHKKCGGHCHHFGEPNSEMDIFKDDEHLATILTYYVKGVSDGIYRNS